MSRATLGQVAAQLCSSLAIWSPSILMPSLGKPGAAWAVLQASTAAEWGEDVRAEAEPGKLGSCFSFYFYLGTQVCYAEAPGEHTAFPSWNQIPSEHYLPFPITVPDLRVEDSITGGTGTSSWLLACCGREGRSWGAALQARSPSFQLL